MPSKIGEFILQDMTSHVKVSVSSDNGRGVLLQCSDIVLHHPCMQASQLQKPGLLSSGSGVGGDTHIEGEKNCAPTAVVDITFVNLVAGRMKGREDGVREEEEEAQTAAKNFKKFRKVHNSVNNKCLGQPRNGPA